MRVEVECYRQRRRSSVLMEAHTVYPWDTGKINFLNPVKILVSCLKDSKIGKVFIGGKDKNLISVFKYRNGEDEDWEEVDASHPIEVAGDQMISISRKQGRVTREVTVFIEPDSVEQETDPQGVFDESPSKPPILVS